MAKELILFQEHHITSREKVAERLRELADKIEDTTFLLGDHEVALPEEVSFKIEADYEEEQGHPVTELGFELRWQPWAEMPAIAKEIAASYFFCVSQDTFVKSARNWSGSRNRVISAIIGSDE